MSEGKKETVGLVVVGHVDSGKSTTTGHLLFELGVMDQRQLEKLKAEADALGKSSFLFAFFTDNQKEERARGITINCSTKEFFTPSYHYTIVDAPGHRDFVKNMLTGASTADIAMLMVPAELGGFEKAIAKGDRATSEVEGQTRQHARLVNLMGIEQVIVCVNKMDDPSVNFRQERFDEIKAEVVRMLAQAGYGGGKGDKVLEKIPFIPISGLKGYNLVKNKATTEMPWYTGFNVKVTGNDGKEKTVTGHTVFDALENYVQPPKRDSAKPFRMPVADVITNIPGAPCIITGRVEVGTLKPGDEVVFVPGDGSDKCRGKVFSIEMHHKSLDAAVAGDNVGINVKGIPKENLPKKGDVMMPASEKRTQVDEFTATVVLQNHPGQLRSANEQGKGGFTPTAYVRTAHAAVQMFKINWKVGKSTNKVKVENPPYVEEGDQAEIVFRPQKPLYLETMESCRSLGRLAILDSNSLVMLGRVTAVKYSEPIDPKAKKVATPAPVAKEPKKPAAPAPAK